MPASLNGKRGCYNLSNLQNNSGGFHILEGFLETQLPLARDKRMAHSLDWNAAVRYADYSLSGGVTTWKTGIIYQPIDGLRLRVTQSRDIRGANIAELFAPGSGTGLGITDPFRNNEQVLGGTTFTTGNPDLLPEKADTTAVGITYVPTAFPEFSATVDWFKIDMTDAISSLGAQNIVNQCFAGATHLCPLIHRGPDGIINLVENPTLNEASLKAEGMDIEFGYHAPLSNIVESWNGSLSARLFASYLGKLESQNLGSAPVDRAGDIRNSSAPKWKAQLNLSYDLANFGLSIRERYIGNAKYDSTWNAVQVDNNRIHSVFYTDLTGRYRFGRDGATEVFVTINNVFDTMPQKTGFLFVVGTQPIGKSLYDQIGRAYTVGVRVSL
jgi:outer membrane receptor protein involved in Fe transport